MAKDNLTAEVKIRLSADEKSRLKQLADDAELTMSEMIRATIFSQKKWYFWFKVLTSQQQCFRFARSWSSFAANR